LPPQSEPASPAQGMKQSDAGATVPAVTELPQ
jgi:hypothetical protein